MANQIIRLQQRIEEIANNSSAHIETEQEFAFAAGQLIYYLLDKSETGNKTHALLEPFLQKTVCQQLQIAISRTIDRYKHAIGFYKGRFEKLAAEVLSYETEVNLKTLVPLILAGYFSDSIIYRKKENVDVAQVNTN